MEGTSERGDEAAEPRALARRVEQLERRVALMERALREAGVGVPPAAAGTGEPPPAAIAAAARRAGAATVETEAAAPRSRAAATTNATPPGWATPHDYGAPRVERQSLRRLGVSRRREGLGLVGVLKRVAVGVVSLGLAVALAAAVIVWQRGAGGGWSDAFSPSGQQFDGSNEGLPPGVFRFEGELPLGVRELSPAEVDARMEASGGGGGSDGGAPAGGDAGAAPASP